MKKYMLISLLLLVSPSIIAVSNGGTQSPFALGVGAKELALGGANLSSVSPATAMFWNGSRLAVAERFEFSGFHSRLFDKDVAYQFIGIAYPMLDYGTFGFGISRLGIDGIEKRDINNFAQDYFDDSRLGVYLAYGRMMKNYNVGVALNIEHHSLDTYKATSSPGLSLSAGKSLELESSLVHSIDAVFQLNNLLKPSIKLANESVKYPSQIDLGLTATLDLPESWKSNLQLASKFYKVDNLDFQFAGGIELQVMNTLGLRAGMRESKYSVGFGIQYKLLSIDYALVDRDLGSIHMFSLTSTFGKTISERKEQRLAEERARFNTLMTDRLRENNNNMIKVLVSEADNHLKQQQLYDAATKYERVLFLQKSNNLDTTNVSRTIADVRKAILKIENEQKYIEYIESAITKLAANQIVEAKYFATLALEIDGSSGEAQRIVDSTVSLINQQVTNQKEFDRQLWMADSLISYGKFAAAERVLNELLKIAPDQNGIKRLLAKVRFESHKRDAENAMMKDQLDLAKTSLNKAESIYPGHAWCLEFAALLNDLNKGPVLSKPVQTAKPLNYVVTDNMRQEVKSLYATAQTYFEQGDLNNAISNWEKVENIIPDYQLVRTYLINAYKYVGVEFYGNNQLREAVRVWQKAQVLDPKNEEIDTYIKRTINEISKMEELTYGEK